MKPVFEKDYQELVKLNNDIIEKEELEDEDKEFLKPMIQNNEKDHMTLDAFVLEDMDAFEAFEALQKIGYEKNP